MNELDPWFWIKTWTVKENNISRRLEAKCFGTRPKELFSWQVIARQKDDS